MPKGNKHDNVRTISENNMSKVSKQALRESAVELDEAETMYLNHGRTVQVRHDSTDDIVEIRSESNELEIRVRITEEGPVLQLEGVRLQLQAAEAIQVQCKQFSIDASESFSVATAGKAHIQSEEELQIESSADVRIQGKMIYLN